MLDIRFVRENLDQVATAMRNRNHSWDSDRFVQLDEERRRVITEEEALLSERNTLSKTIRKLMGEGKKEEAEAAKAQVAHLKERIGVLSAERVKVDDELHSILMSTPNMPADSTPVGESEDDNPEVRRWGTPREFDFDFKPHWDLGTDLGIIDFERAVKLAQSRFVCWRVQVPVLNVQLSTLWLTRM